jgi:hypothetical protein
MFREFQQPPAISLGKVDIANDSVGDRCKASGVASNTQLFSEVFPGGRGACHSCRHERGVTYRRSSVTSACHCGPALFYIRGGRCPREKRPQFVSVFLTGYLQCNYCIKMSSINQSPNYIGSPSPVGFQPLFLSS